LYHTTCTGPHTMPRRVPLNRGRSDGARGDHQCVSPLDVTRRVLPVLVGGASCGHHPQWGM